MVSEMRSTINRVARKSATEHCSCSRRRSSIDRRVSSFEQRSSIESFCHNSRMLKTDSTISLAISTDANEHQQSRHSESADSVAQLLRQQQSVRKLWSPTEL